MQREHIILVGSSVLSLSAGAAAGYFFAMKNLEAKYKGIAEQEIADAKQFYNALHKKEEFETPESTVRTLGLVTTTETETVMVAETAAAIEALRSYQGEEPEDTEQEEVEVSVDVKNIFTESSVDESNFNYEEELDSRTNTAPYVLSHDEFMQSEMNYNQVTLTYFAGDDVLVDEREQPIEDVDATIGEMNLQRFGHGSKDNKIVYVRNEKIELDFEVIRSNGKYTEEVLGFIQHSDSRQRIRRFRGEDE